jgi:Flp pilus assembly protein protease CpaA
LGFIKNNKWTVILSLATLAIGVLGMQALMTYGAGDQSFLVRAKEWKEWLASVTLWLTVARIVIVLTLMMFAWPLFYTLLQKYMPYMADTVAKNRIRIIYWYCVIEVIINFSRMG